MSTNTIINHTDLPITGIYNNLAFSQEEVSAWYVLPVPDNEYGVYPEEAGLPKYLKENLVRLTKTLKKQNAEYHLLVSTPVPENPPIVAVGVKIGDRADRENTILPKTVDKLINLIADAPLNDYISSKELEYWKEKAVQYDQFFGSNLGFKLASVNQLAYLVKKKFYPEIPFNYGQNTELENKGDWGEFYINEITKANIVAYPKHLEISHKIDGKTITGYRTSVEVIKYGDNVTYPEFETWLPYVKSFPFIVDFSVKFKVTKEGYEDITTSMSIEASTIDILVERTEDILAHYESSNMYVVWNSGDQLSLFKESIPTGKNVDMLKRNKTSELAITHIYGNLTFSKQDVYAWVQVPLTQFEYLDDASKKSLAYGMDIALASLATSEERNVECHLLIQGSPFDAREWVQNLNEKQEDDSLPYSKDFLTKMYQYVEEKDFRNRMVLLGVNIGRRSSYAPNKTASPTIMESIMNIIPPVVTDNVSEKEIAYWQQTASQVVPTLTNSRIAASVATTEELAFAIKKNFYPEMPLPSPKTLMIGGDNDKWDKDDIAYLADGNIENNSRYLKMSQVIDGEMYEGYRATLCFAKFPETMYYPYTEPWIHYASLLPFQTDFSLRFTIEPARKVRKEVGRKLKEVIDQAINMESAGGNTSIEVNEHLRSGEELEYTLKKDPSPWIYGRYRVTVEAATVEQLKERIKMVIDHYRAMEIQVVWPTGDQLSLLKEGLPNDTVRVNSYQQRTTLSVISTGVPTGTGTAGDKITENNSGETRGWIGPYLGYTTGHTQEPAFLSMHSTIDNNSSPGLGITGSSGSGKTFCTLTIAYQTALSGAWTIYIDPKADAAKMATLPGLAGHVKVLDLKRGNPGILDPFLIGSTPADQKDLALETIYLFLGGMDKVTEAQQVQLAGAVENIIAKRKNPSLKMIVEYLENSPTDAARSLGAKLNVLVDLPFAQLCFTSGDSHARLRPEDGLTILTLLGLDLPGSDTDRDSYTNSNRLAVGIMYLLSYFTQQLMENADKSHPKSIIIDEAWAITSTRQGINLVQKVARMGRAHNVSLTLVSQNAEDLDKEGVANSISTRLAFRANTIEEAKDVLGFLRLELSDTNKDTVTSLENGECLMKDWSGRIARVYVDAWDKGMADAFETNPRARAKITTS